MQPGQPGHQRRTSAPDISAGHWRRIVQTCLRGSRGIGDGARNGATVRSRRSFCRSNPPTEIKCQPPEEQHAPTGLAAPLASEPSFSGRSRAPPTCECAASTRRKTMPLDLLAQLASAWPPRRAAHRDPSIVRRCPPPRPQRTNTGTRNVRSPTVAAARRKSRSAAPYVKSSDTAALPEH